VLFEKMCELLAQVKEQSLPLVYLDEAVFTFNTFSTKAWAPSYQSITVKEQAVRVKTQAFIGAISLEEGLVDYAIHAKSIKTEEFKLFLEKLSQRFERKPFAVFLDNLSVHKCNLSQQVFKDLSITPIFNIPYSPQFNGIESYFSLLKCEYKKLLLEYVMKGERVDAVELIKMSVMAVDVVKTKKCV
jgi:transposase InsO family protein